MFSAFSHKITRMSYAKRIFLIYLIFIAYDIFIIKSPFSFFKNIIGTRYFVNYLISSITLLFFILFIDLLFKGKFFSKLIAFFAIIIPLGIQTAHYAFYNLPLNAYGIRFFFSEPTLTTQLAFENINFIKIFFYIVFCIFILSLFTHKDKYLTFKKAKMIFYAFLYIPLLTLCGTNWYLILDYQNSMVSVYAALPETARSLYFKTLKAEKPPIQLNTTTKKLPNIVWIIGESVAKSHMSLYGYKRKTTPNLDLLQEKGELVAMQNAVSVGPHTLISVPYMLVGKQNIDPYGTLYSAPHIFDYAKARNYDTAFISAQDLRWKNFDQLTGQENTNFYRSGTDFSPSVSVAKGADDMTVLNEAILPHLKNMQSPFLLIAHMDGSHYPYNIHSTEQYKKFLPEKSPNGTNAYDNTIVYSDIYLQKLIEAARQKDPDVWIFYTTDHGQNVELAKDNQEESDNIDNVTFNQGYSKDIIHNAFFVIPPKEQLEIIKLKKNSPLAQADIFATLLNLMDIEEPAAPIEGISLLKEIPANRLRVSTGYVVTNDNVPEAEVYFNDLSSIFVDFSRNSASFSNNKKVLKLSDTSIEIQNLFVEKDRIFQ